MALIADYARQPRVMGAVDTYHNGSESDIFANPELQYPNDAVVSDISKQVKEVVKVKNDNYTPGSDTETSLYVGLVGIASVAAGIALCCLALGAISTGFGAAAIVIGAAVILLAIKLLRKARSKAGNEVKVEQVFDAAIHQGIGKTIQRHQDIVTGRGRADDDIEMGRLGRGYRRQPLVANAPPIPRNDW